MHKVSVIMPSLNVASYIREAVESVLNQTLTDIEIICVDAGSTDGTLEILKEYEKNDSRVRLIISDRKSYGYQMNLGINRARGEYIGVVETDDYIEPFMYEELFRIASMQGADIVKADFDMFTENGQGMRYYVPYTLQRLNMVEYDKIYSCEDYISGIVKPECYIWNAIYRRGFLARNNIRFNESPGASFQDFSFRYQTVYFADRIVAIDKICYHYRRNNTGASTYNPRTVEFNLRESEYLLGILRHRRISDEKLYTAVANEIAEFAFWPYIEMLKWIAPAESTMASFERFRELIQLFVEKGYLNRRITNTDLWKSASLLLEGVEVYCGYARVMARFQREDIEGYLQHICQYNEIVIFGSGIRGNAAYVFLMNSGIRSIKVFCDNDKKRQGGKMYDTYICSPEEAVKKYDEALFIVTASVTGSEMADQLVKMGVTKERISIYPLSTHPLFCTNCKMKLPAGNIV